MNASLNQAGRRTLEQCEAVIEKSLETCRKHFVEVGLCLDDIKTLELYKGKYGEGCTWERYCQKRWRISKSYADKLIESAQVASNLANGDHGHHFALLPTSERVTRPLAQLPSELQPDAWAEAIKQAGGLEPTAGIIQAVVDKLKSPAKPDPPKSPVKDPDNPIPHPGGNGASNKEPTGKDPQPEIPKANLRKLVGEIWTTAVNYVPPEQEIEVAELFLEILLAKFPKLKGKIGSE